MLSTNTDGALLLRGKNAVVYGAGGAIGGAIARAFAREGAKVFLTGRTLANVEEVAKDIISSGGSADTAQVDALDEAAVEKHLGDIIRKNSGTANGRAAIRRNTDAYAWDGGQSDRRHHRRLAERR